MSEALNHGWRGVLTTEPFRQCLTCGEDCNDFKDVVDRENCCRCCYKAEVERLTAALADRDQKIEEALALCEQAVKYRTADDETTFGLDYINGWNDALDNVEQALRGES